MSTNRSVQAAQKRANPQQTSNDQYRGPGTSINSTSSFKNAAPGRMAGQQAQVAQQNYLAQKHQEIPDSAKSSKISIAQAITLITLRLGRVETMVQNFNTDEHSTNFGSENMGMIDKSLIQNIVSRLDAIEQPQTSSSLSSSELLLIKQQVEFVKNTLSKMPIQALIKEQKEMKAQLMSLKTDITDTKKLLESLQNLVMENSSNIFSNNVETTDVGNDTIDESIIPETTLIETLLVDGNNNISIDIA